jgi:hypothetical protein
MIRLNVDGRKRNPPWHASHALCQQIYIYQTALGKSVTLRVRHRETCLLAGIYLAIGAFNLRLALPLGPKLGVILDDMTLTNISIQGILDCKKPYYSH